MASIRLSRPTLSTPWGFRIHGGKDFQQPLLILKVTGGSIADQCGLSGGDALLQINGRDALNMNHKQAQDLIQSGTVVDFVVQKGASSTWAPQVGGRTLINKQFNTPINLYSEQNLAETMSAQAEVLAGGAIGVNFKKNEKEYNYQDSEVYKMLKEVENEPPAPPEDTQKTIPIGITPYTATGQKSPVLPSSTLPSQQSLLKSVQAPVTNPNPPASSGQYNPNLCAECERLIVGVFVRIKDKNLHVECFKCTTCGTSLKNIGYFNINNKLYCDVHAKAVAKMAPPAPGLEPYATFPSDELVEPGGGGGLLLQVASNRDEKQISIDNLQSQFSENSLYSHNYTASSTSEQITTAGAKKEITRNIPINTYSGGNLGVDTYSANLAPIPFHHSPTQGGHHHVTAPKSPTFGRAPMATGSSLYQGGGSSSGGTSSKIFESKSSSYSSETITKSSGSKFVWPPHQTKTEESSYEQSMSQGGTGSFGLSNTGANSPSIHTTGITIPITNYTQPPSISPNAGYKPVAPPKPVAPTFKPSGSSVSFASSTGSGGTYGSSTSISSHPIGVRGKGQFGTGILPTRGRGILNQPGPRIAVCGLCQKQIRGPFISAGVKIYCPDHFKCQSPTCHRPLLEIGFIEENGGLYCEFCWESYLAPECARCRRRIKNECLNAIGQHFHPTCFMCAHCGLQFHNNPFYLEDGRPYCEKDWNELFTVKCFACGFPIEGGDRWVEALSNNYHSQCFNCSACKKNLEGQSFYAKGGRPFCKQHAR